MKEMQTVFEIKPLIQRDISFSAIKPTDSEKSPESNSELFTYL